ncbi:orotate phosphoribosyl transferase [Talaromyces proteolyticus]|uniref:Orotate phosphoribosyltransferase n=1 Tax=Talaromyces proteolyticus TaxID=1131652 RepID=A0AAD4KG94_9EURO|nr:orotate phosphoribosyl transferase [Talaromyces proteolyticus]KAH8691394.1 orotate phosphoribosyl transferase [Talaromyces proteolyticus]
MSPAVTPDQDYKSSLLNLLVANNALTFGTYTLKSGRESPYFLTSSRLHTAPLLRQTSASFANVISLPPFASVAADGAITPNFDIIFGPAYKGIPECVGVVNELAVRDALAGTSTWDNISYSFNRKEAKDHGEGGNIVGAPLKGKRVLIVDDVITAGTALREAVEIIKKEGGKVAGVVLLFDRQERVSDTERKSAIGAAERDLGGDIPIRAVLVFQDLIEKLGDKIGEHEVRRLEEYRAKYQAE